MKIKFTEKYSLNPAMLMRRCGYGQIRTREISYAKRLGGSEYPRFHAYIEATDEGFTINLHVDQKQPTYGSQTAHSGEYEGELIAGEGNRVRQVINEMKV